MKNKNLFSLILLATICFSCIVMSKTIVVPTPPKYLTIEAALADAKSGDVVIVNPGTYQPYTQNGRLVVGPSITLRLLNGVAVNFNYVSLTIDSLGTFETKGTSASKVLLTFGYQFNILVYGTIKCEHTIFRSLVSNVPWYGIHVMGRGTDNSTFDWCDISDVDNVGVQNLADGALSIYGSVGITVKYCKISNNKSGGIFVGKSQNIYIYKNLLENNRYGVVGFDGSYIFFGPNTGSLSLDCNNGNNMINKNSDDGLHANHNVFMNLSNIDNCNYNSIADNTGYNAVTWDNSTISAVGNYWNPNPPAKIYGNVFWNSVLSCIPGVPRFSIGVIEENNPVIASRLNKATNNLSDIDELLQKAVNFLGSENYSEALSIFKSIISNYRSYDDSSDEYRVYGHALFGISGICRITRDKELLEYLKVISEGKKEALPIEKLVYANTLEGLGSYDEAISEYKAITKSYPGTIHEIRSLVGISCIYLFYKRDIEKAQEILTEVEKIAKEVGISNDIGINFLSSKVYSMSLTISVPDRVLQTAMSLSLRGNNAEALDLFKSIISNYKSYDSPSDEYRVCGHALYFISGICKTTRDKELLGYLKVCSEGEGARLLEKKVYASTLEGLGYYGEAISAYEDILKTLSLTTNEQLQILNSIHFIYLYIKDSEKAKEIESKIKLINDGIVISVNGKINNVNYGSVNANIGEPAQNYVNIANNCSAPYIISQVFLTGDGFILLNETPIIIQPGESKDLIIQFTPTAAKGFECDVIVTFSGTEHIHHTIARLSVGGIDPNWSVSAVDKPTELPTDYSLSQNYPNPFNPTTTIQFAIPKDEYVKLVVYDITGKVVKELVNGYKSAGRYNVEFNASGYASGMYYYKIEAGAYKSVQKMMLMK